MIAKTTFQQYQNIYDDLKAVSPSQVSKRFATIGPEKEPVIWTQVLQTDVFYIIGGKIENVLSWDDLKTRRLKIGIFEPVAIFRNRIMDFSVKPPVERYQYYYRKSA